MMTPADLIAFEAEIAEAFNRGEIRSPVHLSGGNEVQLIDYFEKHWRPGDWTFSSWRSHSHALLAGVPPAEVRAAIMRNRSITLTFPEHRFVTSAIVGGTLPIALGVALGIKRFNDPLITCKVHVFVGDMTAMTGTFQECWAYARGHDLPITFIIEDNGKSVLTDTKTIWGWDNLQGRPPVLDRPYQHLYAYSYDLPFPHAGSGKRVEF